MKLFVICFAIHLVFSAAILILRIVRVLKYDYASIFITFLIPIWGALFMVLKRHSDKHEERDRKPIDVERPTTEAEKKSIPVDEEGEEIVPLSEAMVINDEDTKRDMMLDILYNINKSIVVDDDELKEKVVPLEEALVVNDTATRRSLIIDVLYTNPSDYVSQLYEAKSNGDTEIVHYAATALAEIQKDFDLRFQELAEKKARHPKDDSIDKDYQKVLEDYIGSGLLEGDALKKQLQNYSDLLGEQLKKKETGGRWALLNKKSNADLKLKDIEALDKDIEMMAEGWPDREGLYMFKMQSAILKRDSSLIRSIVKFWDAGFGEINEQTV